MTTAKSIYEVELTDEEIHAERIERQVVISRLEQLLRGETVDGLKIGDKGISREWAENALESYRIMVRNNFDAMASCRDA